MLHQLRYNAAFPGAWRQAAKGFTGQLNFMVAALLARVIREERTGKPENIVEDHGQVTGQNIAAANEATDSADGRELEAQMREEQGHAVDMSPMQVAGYLKSLYNWTAAELLEHARMMVLPDNSKVPDAFHLATPIENTLDFRINAPVRIDENAVKAKAEIYGLTEDEIRAPLLARGKRMAQATARDAERIVEMFKDLRAVGDDGHEIESEVAFDRLPVLYRVRVMAALDRALFNAYKACAADDVAGTRKDAAGDAAHINGMRWELRKLRNEMLKEPKAKREYEDALANSPEPTWPAEPRMSLSKAA